METSFQPAGKGGNERLLMYITLPSHYIRYCIHVTHPTSVLHYILVTAEPHMTNLIPWETPLLATEEDVPALSGFNGMHLIEYKNENNYKYKYKYKYME